MKTRAITGFIFVLVMLASLLSGAYIFVVFYGLLSLLCLTEFFNLVKRSGINPDKRLGLLLGFILLCSFVTRLFVDYDSKWLLLNILLFLAIFIRELYKKSKLPFSNIAYTFFGLLYTVIPFVCFISVAFISGTYNFHIALGFFLMLWANDTGAYLFGVKFGKHRLFERHSPKKSWEGFFGGIFTAVLTGYLLSVFYTDYAYYHWMAMALIISCLGTLGDLTESMFKRSIDIKDSGKILPGHGGVLDRFDGLLLSAPAIFVYLYLITN